MNINFKFITDAIEALAEDIKKLNENIEKADKSSTNLSRALNRLTFWGVLIAAIGTFALLLQFLYENRIWPFFQ